MPLVRLHDETIAKKMKHNPAYFNPDDVVITKEHLYKMINVIIARWQKDEKKHFWQIKALQTFRLSLRFQSDEAIAEVIKSIILFVNKMQEANAILTMKEQHPKTSDLVDMIAKKLEKDGLDLK